jgi:hypothetical protein
MAVRTSSSIHTAFTQHWDSCTRLEQHSYTTQQHNVAFTQLHTALALVRYANIGETYFWTWDDNKGGISIENKGRSDPFSHSIAEHWKHCIEHAPYLPHPPTGRSRVPRSSLQTTAAKAIKSKCLLTTIGEKMQQPRGDRALRLNLQCI